MGGKGKGKGKEAVKEKRNKYLLLLCPSAS